MSKRLYIVTISTERIVVADSAEEAEQLALSASLDDENDLDVAACDMTFYPPNWDNTCIPFGFVDKDNPDRTVGQWIRLGAAPNMKECNNG